VIEQEAEFLCHLYEPQEQSEKLVIGFNETFYLPVNVLEIDYLEHESEGVGLREAPERVGGIS
jgi:hypothetical protein